ncbi:hypothetical protein G3I15_52620, partial [Streptomyces sp. SID10244]|nr:hypothetical protein [Streptomyces sp. SID10244]
DQLADLPDVIGLPSDRPRPDVASLRGGLAAFDIPADLVHAVDDLARRHGATPFMVLHAALAALLGRIGDTTDVAIATPVAGRGQSALDDVIGMFVNTLV